MPLRIDDEPRERGRHLGPQRHRALALVHKVVELADDLFAALEGEKLERFQRRTIVFAEAVAPRHLAPVSEEPRPRVRAPDVVRRQRLRVKISEARKSLHV